MFDQVKSLMLAKGETVQGDDPSLIDHYAQLVNEQLSAMNNAWYDAQEAAEQGEKEQERLEILSKEVGKVLCAVAAFGYSFGFPVGAIVEQVIREGEALKSPMFDSPAPSDRRTTGAIQG